MPDFMRLYNVFSKIIDVFYAGIIGFGFFYVFDPLVEFIHSRLEKLVKREFKNRFWATLILYLFIALIVLFLLSLAVEKINGYGKRDFFENISEMLIEWKSYALEVERLISGAVKFPGVYNMTKSFALNEFDSLSSLWNNPVELAVMVIKAIARFVLGAVISFYILVDKERLRLGFNNFLKRNMPEKPYNSLKAIICDVDSVFSGYLRGQLTDAVIMSGLISFALSILGIRFSVAIGIISGFSNIIPYFGAIIAMLLAGIITLLDYGFGKTLITLLVILCLQQLDSIYISPRVVGQSVKLSPLLVILSLMAGGGFFGITGMIFAVPVVATVKALALRIENRKKLII